MATTSSFAIDVPDALLARARAGERAAFEQLYRWFERLPLPLRPPAAPRPPKAPPPPPAAPVAMADSPSITLAPAVALLPDAPDIGEHIEIDSR